MVLPYRQGTGTIEAQPVGNSKPPIGYPRRRNIFLPRQRARRRVRAPGLLQSLGRADRVAGAGQGGGPTVAPSAGADPSGPAGR